MDTSLVHSIDGDLVGFPDGPRVELREVDAKFWTVLRAFRYYADSEVFDVRVGQRTDFASVPRAFVWFIPSYGRYTKAAILHDHLCDRSRAGTFHRRDADGVFRQAMRTLGVPLMRRWIMWAAVRWGSLGTADGRKGWWSDAAKVMPITLGVLPILAPAAVVVTVTLLVWYGLELVAWVPLSLIAHVRRKRHQPVKRVNRPDLSWKL